MSEDPVVHLLADGRVNDRVDLLQCIGVREHDLCDGWTIEFAVGVDHLIAESLRQRDQNRRTRTLHVAHDLVGVDDDRAAGRQHLRHRGLARTDTAREADEDHGRDAIAP